MRKLILILTLAGFVLSPLAVVETQAARVKAKPAAKAKAGQPKAQKKLGKQQQNRKQIQRLKAKLRKLRGR